MNEYSTEAIVLDKEISGERDSRVWFYTKELGKVVARVVSARKITSKLAAHFEPLNIVNLRLVDKNFLLAVDGLIISKLENGTNDKVQILRALQLIKETSPERQPDQELWDLIRHNTAKAGPEEILRVQGFDPRLALCRDCGRPTPENFLYYSCDYLCHTCLIFSQMDEKRLVLYN